MLRVINPTEMLVEEVIEALMYIISLAHDHCVTLRGRVTDGSNGTDLRYTHHAPYYKDASVWVRQAAKLMVEEGRRSLYALCHFSLHVTYYYACTVVENIHVL